MKLVSSTLAKFGGVLLAVLLAGSVGGGVATAQEVIHRFDSVVRVSEHGTLNVTETIRVRAEGREIKRGIYRDFPLTFRDNEGRVREVSFRLIGVLRDGRPEPHFTRRQGGSIRIYAGQEDVFLRRGDYTYTFTYETGRQIRWFDGGAELYWNVTGNAWSFPIALASVRVELPGGARPVRWTAYTGPLGARGTDWRGAVNSGGALVAETTRRLGPSEGFTIVAALPTGAVIPPSETTQLWYMFLDNRRWILGGIGFLLVLGYYAFAWFAVGRDPKRGIVIPLFHPPAAVSPALASYIRNWGFSRDPWRAFTAAALSLAVRGLLLFDQRDGDLTLKATGRRDGEASLPPGERAIFNWVTAHGGKAEISRSNATAVAEVGKQFQKSVEAENKDRFFRKNLGYFFAGALLTVLVVVALFTFGGLRDDDIFVVAIMGFIGVWLGVFLVPLLLAVFGFRGRRSAFRAALPLIVMVGLFVYFVSQVGVPAALVGSAFDAFVSVVEDNPFPFALVMFFTALNGLFLYLLRAPTDIGRPVMDQLEGFRLYLTTAETPRLNMDAPEITAERFEALLPYAVALDAEQPWSDAFAAALARAHPGESNPMHHYHPTWTSSGNWSSSNFGRSISSSVASAAGSFASAVPVSSGSSGFSSGGGSGGGGGGGGGGGW